MTKESTKVYKVNATIDDDINLIVDTIQKVDSEMILLVLPEGNDLMNSPVGLKTLKRKSLTMHKAMIVVAPNKQYQKLSEDAGFITITNQDADATMWEKALGELEDFKQSNAGLNSARNTVQKASSEVVPPPTGKKINETVKEKSIDNPRTDDKEFGYKVSSVQVNHQADEDKPVVGPVKQQGSGMIGMDFSKVVSQAPPTIAERFTSIFKKKESIPTPKIEEDENLPQVIKPQYVKAAAPLKTNNALRAAGVILLGILILAAGSFAVYYMYVPKLRVEIKVTSDKIELNDKYTATTAVTGFDAAKKQFQLVKENAEQKGSVNITATGDGKDGTKASGQITIGGNIGPTPINLPAGTVVTAAGGQKFVTQAEIQVKVAPLNGTGSIVATDFGSEYNLPQETNFEVTGFSQLSGKNAVAYSGGTKREFKVLSQKDVDDAVDQLKKDLFDQLKSDLQFRNQNNGYEYIQESFVSKVEGTPVVNPAVGTETSQAFMEMNTTATAFYYHKESFQKMVEKFTADQYKLNKSLSADTDVMLDSPSIQISKVTVEKDDKVSFEFKSSSLVTPRINVDQLRKDIAGKKWEEMLTRLSSINTLAATPTTTFYPTWMPTFLRYVPAEEGRVDVSVKVESQ